MASKTFALRMKAQQGKNGRQGGRRVAGVTCNLNARNAAAGVMGKAHGVEGGRPSQEDAEVECVGCRQKLPLQAFDAERLRIWKRNRNISKHAKCKACCANPSEEDAEVECVGCRKKIPLQAFDAERLNT